MRGISIFGMIFVHVLDDLYDFSWTETDASLSNAPLVAVVMLIMGLYLGSWAGLFLMVSSMSNMISMYKNLDRGRSVKSIVIKQVVGGFILLIFGFLAEGLLQYYAVFQTLRAGNPDWSRILWKSYTMETIHTIAWCMMINGVIQGLLSLKNGHKKIKRNMIIYGVLAVIVFALTQPVWNWLKDLIPGYPFDPYNTGRDMQRPSVGASFGEYVLKFFLLPLGGHPEPIFPFLSVSFIGNIIGLQLCKKVPSRTWPKWGVVSGLFILAFGAAFGILSDLPFDSFLPLNDFSTFSRIGDGLNWRWVPWVCFITGGQVVFVSVLFRLVEFRGKADKFAEKTKFFRRFGMIPFTLYTFHRIIAMFPLWIMSLILQRDVMIDCHNLNGYASLALIGLVIVFIHFLIKAWEKYDYIGSLEWMIGSIGAYALGVPRRSKENKRWYRWGVRNQQEVFYNVEWIDVFDEGDYGEKNLRDSKLALKFSILGFFLFPATFIGLAVAKSSQKTDGQNKYNKGAKIIGWAAAIVNVGVLILLTFTSLSTFGISL